MAIDDNTSYELTGAQVKDLASKINGKADASSVPAAQVNSDWNATSGVAEILNKPTIPAAQVNSDWNASSGVAEILNKPTIPTVNDATLTITQNGTSAGTFTANSATDTTIALTDTTYSNFVGTDGTAAGAAGLVPAPATTDDGKYLKSDGTWDSINLSHNGVDTYYGTCGTQYYTGTKDVTTSSDFELRSGVVLFVKFTYYNTQSSVYLRVNNGTSKLVYANGDSSTGNTYMWKSNDVVCFVYDGSYWRMVDSDKATSSYYGKVKLASSYTSSSSDTVPTSYQLYSVYGIANSKQDQLTAGTGITINGNVISASGGGEYTYTGSADPTNNKFTTTLTDGNNVSQDVVLNAGDGITFSASSALGAIGPNAVPNTMTETYVDISGITFTPVQANNHYLGVLRVRKNDNMGSITYTATVYQSYSTYGYSSAAEITAAVNNGDIVMDPSYSSFFNYFNALGMSTSQSTVSAAIAEAIEGTGWAFGGNVTDFGQSYTCDVYVFPTTVTNNVISGNVYTAGSGISITNNVISATGGGGGGGITGDDAVVIADGAIANAFYAGSFTITDSYGVAIVDVPTQASPNYYVAITPTSLVQLGENRGIYVYAKNTANFGVQAPAGTYDFIVFGQMATPNADLAALSDPDSINSGDIRGELEELTTLSN